MNYRPNRRSFVSLGISGLFGASLLNRLRASEKSGHTTSTNMILVWLGGGPSTIDMWDLKPNATEQIRGEFKPISTSVPGIQICEHLPSLAKQMHHCVLIRSLHHSIPAHGPGSQYVLTGNKPSTAVDYPAMGSIASRLLENRAGMPSYISFGNAGGVDAGYLGGAYNSFEVSYSRSGASQLDGLSLPDGFSKADLKQRGDLQKTLDAGFTAVDTFSTGLKKAQQQSIALLRSEKMRKAFDLEQESKKVQENYGRSEVGRNTLVASRLIDAGARFVTINMTGWDTHAQNFGSLRNQLLPSLDQALAGLLGDLHERGRLSDTVVCCMGEFGRTPTINGNAGRDHWSRAMSALVAGGGLKRGIAYGATDKNGQAPVEKACNPSDLAATLISALGIAPDHRLTSATGRPMSLFKNGTPISEIMA